MIKIQTYLYAKARSELSEAVVGADGDKYLCYQQLLTRVDIDDHHSRGVKSQIFKLLAFIGYSPTLITIIACEDELASLILGSKLN